MHRKFRAEVIYKLKNDQTAQLTVSRCTLQTQAADKYYVKLLNIKKQAILGKTHSPHQAERRIEVYCCRHANKSLW